MFDPAVMCWACEDLRGEDFEAIPVVVVPSKPLPHQGAGRWLWRLRNLAGRNFYGSVGAERRALVEVVELLRPQVILCHFGTVGLRVLPAAIAAGVPMVVHFHGVDISAALSDRWYRTSLKRYMQHFAAMVVVADYQRETLIALGAKRERVQVIPCGVPITDEAPSAAVAKQPCRFLAVGRLVAKKAPGHTLRAFAWCLGQVPGCRLTLIGDGPMFPELRMLATELGIEESVEFLGSQPTAVVAAELRRAAVFVQHSVTSPSGDMEGWPVSVAEAMAAGLPVVATRHAGILAQVSEGDSGFLVDEHDWQAMGVEMACLAADPALRRVMGERSQSIARQGFDQAAMVARLEAVMLEVLGNPGPPRPSPAAPAHAAESRSNCQ